MCKIMAVVSEFYIVIIIAIITPLIFFGCRGKEIELTKDFIGNLKIAEEKSEDGNSIIRISGFSFHSALGISRIDSEVDGDTLIVKIYVDGKSKDGNFQITKNMPENISRIKLFNDIIWTRGVQSD